MVDKSFEEADSSVGGHTDYPEELKGMAKGRVDDPEGGTAVNLD